MAIHLRIKTCVRLRGAGLALVLLAAHQAQAQSIDAYLPAGIPGFDQSRGVTVLTRARPGTEDQGVRLGSFLVHAGLDELVGYSSNVNGQSGGPGSWYVDTSPYVSANYDGSRSQFGVAATATNAAYFDTSALDRTDWSASLGGSTTIGRGNASLAYSHQAQSQVGTELGAVPTNSFVPYTVDDVRAAYNGPTGRLTLTPNVDDQIYRFGTGQIGGTTTDQSYRNRNVLSGGLTVAYALNDLDRILVVLQGVRSQYDTPQTGVPSPDSDSVLAMAGLDIQGAGPLQYRVLAGVENRFFAASLYPTQTAPIIQAGVTWTPTGLATVTATASRLIEDASSLGIGGDIFNSLSLTIDHEYLRNILLQARARGQLAEYVRGGSQTNLSLGAGVTWLATRHIRVSVNVDYTKQGASGQPAGLAPIETVSGAYEATVATLAVHLGL